MAAAAPASHASRQGMIMNDDIQFLPIKIENDS